jgi:hypothetical protein
MVVLVDVGVVVDGVSVVVVVLVGVVVGGVVGVVVGGVVGVVVGGGGGVFQQKEMWLMESFGDARSMPMVDGGSKVYRIPPGPAFTKTADTGMFDSKLKNAVPPEGCTSKIVTSKPVAGSV